MLTIAVGPTGPFPLVQSLNLNIGAIVGEEHDQRFVCIGVPQDVPRFLKVGSRGVRVAVEDAILHLLPSPLQSEVGSAAASMSSHA